MTLGFLQFRGFFFGDSGETDSNKFFPRIFQKKEPTWQFNELFWPTFAQPCSQRIKEHADLLASLDAAGTFSAEDVELLGRRFHSLEELRGAYERCPKGEIFGFSLLLGAGNTLLGANISPIRYSWVDDFPLFPRWDMLVPCWELFLSFKNVRDH